MAMSYGGIMYFPLNVSFFEDAPIELVEATKRRKRDFKSLPYLMESCTKEEGNTKTDPESRMQNEGNCMQPVDIFTENADNSEQSKVKQTKLEQTKAETEGGSPGENSFLTPPEYAYNKQTHNYDGLLFTLKGMRIQNPEEVNAILRLSDYGRLRGYVWQVIHGTRWSEVAAKGKYLIAALVKERKKKAAG